MRGNPLKIAIYGPSGAGKDATALWLSRNSILLYRYPTSRIIVPKAARMLQMTDEEAYRRRHEFRHLFRHLGDEMRRDDPAHLARECLKGGDILVGVRARVEAEAVRAEGLVDLSIFIRRDVPPDPTLEFDSSLCDLVIENDGTLDDLHAKLRRLAGAMGILRVDAPH